MLFEYTGCFLAVARLLTLRFLFAHLAESKFAVKGHHVEDDVETLAILVGPGCPYLCPVTFLGLFVFSDVIDVVTGLTRHNVVAVNVCRADLMGLCTIPGLGVKPVDIASGYAMTESSNLHKGASHGRAG